MCVTPGAHSESRGEPGLVTPVQEGASLAFRYAFCGMWMKEGRRLAVSGDGDPILLGECG